MSQIEAATKTKVTIATVGAATLATAVISFGHYETIPSRLGFLIWSISPYPFLWLLATRARRKSTQLFWVSYAFFALAFAIFCYLGPRFSHTSWHGMSYILGPGYLLIIGIIAFIVFATVRWIFEKNKSM